MNAVSSSPMTLVDRSSSLTLTMLGPLSVQIEEKPLPRLRSRKSLWLLVLLALRQGRPVEREWLAGTLWPDTDQSSAFDNLRPVLSQLRSAMGSQAYRLVSPNRHTLYIDLEGANVDVLAFDSAIASKRHDALERAVALYRGPLLEGCTEDWVFQERAAREQACRDALQRLAEAALQTGDPATAANYLRRASSIDPLSDSVHQSLMEALAKCGDRNAALNLYREFSERLRREMAAAPHEETTALYRKLRTEARQGASRVPAAGVPEESLPTPLRVSGSLPCALTELVGREDEQREIATRLRRSHLVTLTGPGGIGKTRLAVAVADAVLPEFPDGVCLVALESLPAGGSEEDRRVVQQIAAALEVREGSGLTSLLQSITEHLRRKRLLLVLDNCEHVLESVARVIAPLLRECLGVRMLATSREAIGITGETAWMVPSLAVPDPAHLPEGRSALARAISGYDAVQLFVERARAAQRTFDLTGENAHDIARLCARLEGVPLALELAAARTVVLTPAQILAQLDTRPLDALSARGRDIAPRHRTLRATLTWSYDLLPPGAQTFLASMGVFRGGWTLEAAQAVCPNADALEMLTVLKEASLITTAANDAEGGTRFHFLETVRQFAVEALEASGYAADIRRRHALYYAGWIKERHDGWMRERGEHDRFLFFAFIEREYANITAALSSAREAEQDEILIQLCHELGVFWQRNGRRQEGRAWMETAARRILARADREDALIAEGEGDASTPFLARRETYLDLQIWIFRELGDRKTTAELSLQVFEGYRRAGNPVGGRTKLFNAGVAYAAFDLPRARTLLEENLLLEKAFSSDGRGNPVIFSQLAMVYRLCGQHEQAAAYLAETLEICRGREESDPHGYARAMWLAGTAALEAGEHSLAQERFDTSVAVANRLADRLLCASVFSSLMTLAQITGNQERAEAYLTEAIERAGVDPPFLLELTFYRQQAELMFLSGDTAGAAALVRGTLAQIPGYALSFRLLLNSMILLLADTEGAGGSKENVAERMARLVGAAQGLSLRMGLVHPEWRERERAVRLRTVLADRLGSERLAEAIAEGADLDDEAALEFTLAVR